jgi:hypothetical protein
MTSIRWTVLLRSVRNRRPDRARVHRRSRRWSSIESGDIAAERRIVSISWTDSTREFERAVDETHVRASGDGSVGGMLAPPGREHP